jgi:hypothetical protein
VRLQAFGVHDEGGPVVVSIVGFWVFAAILPGAALGGVWPGCDLPWVRR